MPKNIIITGAANGIGRAISKKMQTENLMLVDTDERNLKSLANELGQDYYVCDVSEPNQIKQLISYYNKQIDCLINCAGVWISGEISQLEQPIFEQMNQLDKIKKAIDTNIFGTIAMIKEAYLLMGPGGLIININSQSGVVCEPPFPIYNATKQGATAFRKAVQDDLARNKIKITDIYPGLVKTDFYKRADNELPSEIMRTGLEPNMVADIISYIFHLPDEITIPSIEIKHINNH